MVGLRVSGDATIVPGWYVAQIVSDNVLRKKEVVQVVNGGIIYRAGIQRGYHVSEWRFWEKVEV